MKTELEVTGEQGEKPKFTPGPWVIATSGFFEGVCIRAADNRWVAQVWSQHEGVELPRDANARLIAASPALYEAMRQFVHWYAEDSTEENRDNAYDAAVAALALVDGPQTKETK